MAVFEGRTPARRPHHVVELAEVVMSRSSQVVFRLGGLGALEVEVEVEVEVGG